MATKNFHKGDAVSWQSRQGTVHGEVQEKIEKDTRIKGHKVKASKDNPQYRVQSDSTGAEAAHKPGALKREKARSSS